jgi:MFS family permease
MTALPSPRQDRPRWRAALSALAHRDFLLLWIGGGLDALGTAILGIALTKLVYDQTASATGVGLLVFTSWFSMVIVAPLGGVLADRLNRRTLLVGAGILSAGLVILFVWIHSTFAAYVLNFVLVSASMLVSAARSAILPDIVDKGQLLDANALQQSLSTLVSISGPLLGGVIVERCPAPVTFTLCSALYLTGALCRLLIQIAHPSMSRGSATLRGVYEGFVEGVRYARVHPVVSTLIVIFLMIGAGFGMVLGLDMVFAERVLADESFPAATAYSYLMSATSTGIFVGSLLVRYLGRRFAKKRVLMVGLSTLGIESLALAFVRNLPFALAIKFGRGIGSGINMSLYPTLLQENVEQEQQGRAVSLFLGAASIAPSLTIYLGSWLADRTSVQAVYGLAGVWILLSVAATQLLPGYRAIPVRAKTETESEG